MFYWVLFRTTSPQITVSRRRRRRRRKKRKRKRKRKPMKRKQDECSCIGGGTSFPLKTNNENPSVRRSMTRMLLEMQIKMWPGGVGYISAMRKASITEKKKPPTLTCTFPKRRILQHARIPNFWHAIFFFPKEEKSDISRQAIFAQKTQNAFEIEGCQENRTGDDSWWDQL